MVSDIGFDTPTLIFLASFYISIFVAYKFLEKRDNAVSLRYTVAFAITGIAISLFMGQFVKETTMEIMALSLLAQALILTQFAKEIGIPQTDIFRNLVIIVLSVLANLAIDIVLLQFFPNIIEGKVFSIMSIIPAGAVLTI